MNDVSQVALPADPHDTAINRPRPLTIYPLQYLRAFAAFAVVMCHASYYIMQSRGDGSMWQLFARAGGFGVVLFFAISGFLMAELATNTPPLKFLAHRLIRIYPIYWLCVLVVVLLSHLGSAPIRPDLLSLLLVPGGTRAYVLGVEWTLPFELTFYVIVFAIIASRLQRWLPAIAAVWVVLIEVLAWAWPGLQQGQFPLLFNLPFSQFSLAFAAGLLVPRMIERGLIGPATPLLALAMIGCSEAAGGFSPILSSSLMGFGCVLMVAAAVNAGKKGAAQPAGYLVALGDWSYALYLIHVPVIRALCALAPASVPTMTLWVACLSVPLATAVLFGKIDLRMYKALKLRVDGSGDRLRLVLALVFGLAVVAVAGMSYVRVYRTRMLSEDVAAVAAKVEAGLNGDLSRLPVAANAAGLRSDDAVKGYLDDVFFSSEGMQVQGWAADSSAAHRKVRVLVFYCGRFAGVAPVQDIRPDVATLFQAPTKDLGFNATLPLHARCEAPVVKALLIVSDGSFTVLEKNVH